MASPEIRLGMLDGFLGFLLRKAHLVVYREFVDYVGQGEIRSGTFSLMALVGENPGILQSELAALLVLDKAALTELLNELERGSFIKRKRSNNDLRRSGVFLTPDGAARLGQMKRRFAEFDRQLQVLFIPEERALLVTLLERLCEWRGTAASPMPLAERKP